MMDPISDMTVADFSQYLDEDEKSAATIDKYTRDVKAFLKFCLGRPVTKEVALSYKAWLQQEGYAVRSINSMLASLNSFFTFLGKQELKIKPIRLQQQIFRPEEKEMTRQEYERLCEAAMKKKNERLLLVMQTLCGTGIRISELRFITVEAIKRGEAEVSCKGKTRAVFLVKKLQEKLLCFASKHGYTSGPVFVTRTGKPLNRCNIWREMKALCAEAGIHPGKVFPHNFRHLFACVFYKMEKDIGKLADILGHSNINTTRIYILSTGLEHRLQMERMRLIL